MKISLLDLFSRPDGVINIEYTLSCDTALSRQGDASFPDGVRVRGVIRNDDAVAGLAHLNAHVDAILHTRCDRCDAPMQSPLSFDIDGDVSRHSTGDDDIIAQTDETGCLDLDAPVMSHIALNMPMKLVCAEDCKGLCAHCGVDLNREDCRCSGREIDPRLLVLRTLLDEDKN